MHVEVTCFPERVERFILIINNFQEKQLPSGSDKIYAVSMNVLHSAGPRINLAQQNSDFFMPNQKLERMSCLIATLSFAPLLILCHSKAYKPQQTSVTKKGREKHWLMLSKA